MACLRVHLERGFGHRRRVSILFLTLQEGVLLSPQHQRRRVDLTEPRSVIDREHHPLDVVAPDTGGNFEALREQPREELFGHWMVDRTLLELPNELGRDGIS